jgi:hypothetical protein
MEKTSHDVTFRKPATETYAGEKLGNQGRKGQPLFSALQRCMPRTKPIIGLHLLWPFSCSKKCDDEQSTLHTMHIPVLNVDYPLRWLNLCCGSGSAKIRIFFAGSGSEIRSSGSGSETELKPYQKS